MSRFGPSFDAVQRRWDNLSEDDVYGPEVEPADEDRDYEGEALEQR